MHEEFCVCGCRGWAGLHPSCSSRNRHPSQRVLRDALPSQIAHVGSGLEVRPLLFSLWVLPAHRPGPAVFQCPCRSFPSPMQPLPIPWPPQALSVLALPYLMASESTGGTLSHTSRQGGGGSQGEEWPFSSCLPENVPGTLPFCPWAEEGLPSPGLHHTGGGGNFFLTASVSSARWEARSPTQSDDGQGGVGVWRMEEQVSSWEWESDWRRKSPWLAG